MTPRTPYTLLLLALVTYTVDVEPILRASCVECHSTGASLNLSRFPFLSAATDDQQTIVERMLARAGTANPSMPPGNRPKLTPSQATLLEQWQEQGLPD